MSSMHSQAPTVFGKVYSIYTDDSADVHEWLADMLDTEEQSYVLISRLPPRRLLHHLDLTKVETHWLTEKQAASALSPRLEKMDSSLRQRVSKGQGIAIIEGLEYLVGLHGWDGVLTYVRSMVDAVGPTRWMIFLAYDPLSFEDTQVAMLRREAAVFSLPKPADISSSEIVDDDFNSFNDKSSRQKEISADSSVDKLPESHLDLAEDGTPRLSLLVKIPESGFTKDILRRRILSWRRMGIDVSELEPALKYSDISRAFALYNVVEEKIRIAVEIDRVIDSLASSGDLANAQKFRFRIRQLTGLEEIIRSLNTLLAEE